MSVHILRLLAFKLDQVVGTFWSIVSIAILFFCMMANMMDKFRHLRPMMDTIYS